MAESAAAQTALQKTLECSVCFLVYNNETRQPKTLKCGHTFCKYCVDSLESNSVVKCPKCREDTPSCDVKTNFIVAEMLEALCAECKEKSGEVHCAHCGDHFCQLCFERHVQAFPADLASKVELLKEEIEKIWNISTDSTTIKAERAKADKMLRKIRCSFLVYHEFLEKCQAELEKQLSDIKDKNIKSVLSWRANVNTGITNATKFVDAREDMISTTPSLTQEEMVRFNEDIASHHATLKQMTNSSFETVDYDFLERKDVSEMKRSDVGEIIAPDYRTATVKHVAGGKGKGRDQFDCPRGVAVSADGYLIVTDESNHRIKVYDKTLTCMSTFGTKGTLAGQFQRPQGVAVAPDGKVYVAEFGNNRIQVLTMVGYNVVNSDVLDVTGLSGPSGLAFDKAGHLYICDIQNHRVEIIKQDGSHVNTINCETVDSIQGEPAYVALTREQYVLISYINLSTIGIYDKHGCYLRKNNDSLAVTVLEMYGIGVDRIGNTVVGNFAGGLVVFDKDENFICTIGSRGDQRGQMKGPSGITFDDDGNIIVCDDGNNRIQVFEVNNM